MFWLKTKCKTRNAADLPIRNRPRKDQVTSDSKTKSKIKLVKIQDCMCINRNIDLIIIIFTEFSEFKIEIILFHILFFSFKERLQQVAH